MSARSLRQKKNGEQFLTMTLRDRTGTLSAVCWEAAASLQEIASRAPSCTSTGRYELHERWGAQLTVQALAPRQRATTRSPTSWRRRRSSPARWRPTFAA